MAKKSAKRSKPSGRPAAKGRRPAKGSKRPAPKRVVRKRPPKPGQSPHDAPPREDGERLQKVLAAAGLGSRRGCEELILEGRVQIDGEIVSELGARVDPGKQTIHVDGEALTQPKLVYFAVNKPTGVVCTARDPSGRPRVTDLLPPSVGRVFNVGRLDMSSEGLILVTNDGELANRLTHPRHGVEKLYHVQVAGEPSAEALKEVRSGVYLDEGRVAFSNVKVKSRRKGSTILEVILDEGRNREIRRVLARVGHKVQKLERIAVGPVRLGEMPSGAYRPLTREELKALQDATKPGRKKPTEAKKSTEAKKPAGERPKRKRPPRKPPEKKPERPTVGGRRIIGLDDEAAPAEKPASPTGGRAPRTASGKPSDKTARPPKHRPHKHKPAGKPAAAKKRSGGPAKGGPAKGGPGKGGKPKGGPSKGGRPKGKR